MLLEETRYRPNTESSGFLHERSCCKPVFQLLTPAASNLGVAAELLVFDFLYPLGDFLVSPKGESLFPILPNHGEIDFGCILGVPCLPIVPRFDGRIGVCPVLETVAVGSH